MSSVLKPRHRDALAVHRWGWDELDRLAGLQTSIQAVPDPDLLRPAPRRPTRWLVFALPPVLTAAAALAFALWRPSSPNVPDPAPEPSPAPSYALAAPIEQLTLEDGSVVALNRGAMLDRTFTPAERRVHLLRGEATFTGELPIQPVLTFSRLDIERTGAANLGQLLQYIPAVTSFFGSISSIMDRQRLAPETLTRGPGCPPIRPTGRARSPASTCARSTSPSPAPPATASACGPPPGGVTSASTPPARRTSAGRSARS